MKHSTEIVQDQARHLIDPEKCAMTEHRYGLIKKRTVLYRGTTQDVDGIRYVNVEEYLKDALMIRAGHFPLTARIYL